jgi:hypothetical protein
MARIRTIKHEFFLDEELAKLGAHARLCFIGLWTLADRDGRLEDRPARIRAELFPYEPRVSVESMLSDLEQAGFVVRYEVDGRAFIAIRTFAKHQRPNLREPASEIPAPSAVPCTHVHARAEQTMSDRSAARNGSGEGKGMDPGKGMENGGELALAVLPPSRSGDLAALDPVQAVFAHYRTYHPKAHPKPRREDKEYALIQARLAGGLTAAQLCAAIDGFEADPFHRGENDRQTAYLSLKLFMRDASKVQQGIELAARAGKRPMVVTAKDSKTLSAAASWASREGENEGT